MSHVYPGRVSLRPRLQLLLLILLRLRLLLLLLLLVRRRLLLLLLRLRRQQLLLLLLRLLLLGVSITAGIVARPRVCVAASRCLPQIKSLAILMMFSVITQKKFHDKP